MNPDHRAYLEAIATSSDASVRPADRIRAIELLQDAAGENLCRSCSELRSLSDDELDRELDNLNTAVVSAALGGSRDRPQTAAAIEAAIERRAEERARELADRDQIERLLINPRRPGQQRRARARERSGPQR